MISIPVKYKGFDGEDIEEIVRLHLTKAEFLKLDMKYSEYGGLINYLRKLLTDMKEDNYIHPLLKVLDTLILAAYGRKTEDGKFVKKLYGQNLADEFESSETYSQLLLDLMSEKSLEDNKIEDLIFGILPVDEVNKEELRANRDKMMGELGVENKPHLV